MSASVDTASYFSLSHFSTSWEQNSRKAVLPRHATTPSFGLLDFSFGLLALAWSSLLLLCYRQLARHCPSGMASADARYGLPFGAAPARAHQGIALGVYELVRSTPPPLAPWGSHEELIADDDQQAALR